VKVLSARTDEAHQESMRYTNRRIRAIKNSSWNHQTFCLRNIRRFTNSL